MDKVSYDNVINIEHLTKDYGNNRGVFDLSFGVRKGEVLGFLGPNGAGKTTTIRHLLGFISPDSGSVSILGKDCFTDADKIRGSIGYLPGEIAFVDKMDAAEFIKFVAKMKKIDDFTRAEELMEMFELKASGKIKRMSKGMKQKIGIVCAFMQNPEIIILDEPTSGLDPLMQNRFVELVKEEKRAGHTILMSSHVFEEIEKTCDRAVIIKDGQKVAMDSMEKLCGNRKKDITVTFEDESTAAMFAEIVMGQSSNQCSVDGSNVTVKSIADIDDVVKQMSHFTVKDINVHTQTLEEFFLHFYGNDEKIESSFQSKGGRE